MQSVSPQLLTKRDWQHSIYISPLITMKNKMYHSVLDQLQFNWVFPCSTGILIPCQHASLSWLRVEERLTASLLLFIRNNAFENPKWFV